MKPKSHVLIAFCLLSLLVTRCTTTHEIRLKRVPIANINRRAKDLAFVNYADTAFLNIIRSGDMGVRFDSSYEFKPNVKNTKYLIFVDDTLVEKQAFKNGQRHGMYRMYFRGAKYCEIPYFNGKAYGKGYFYFTNGKLKSVVAYENGRTIIRWTYNENHILKREEFFLTNTVRIVDYDNTGHIINIRNEQPILNIDPDTIGALQSGEKVYSYKQGNFTIYYKNGKNKKWIFSPAKK